MIIDIYATPTCGYYKQLKACLAEKSIAFTTHDPEKRMTFSRKILPLC